MKINEEPHFLNDGDIAVALRVSKSWVRQQRFKRRRKLPHVLELDPVVLNRAPRYPKVEFDAWLAGLEQNRDAVRQ